MEKLIDRRAVVNRFPHSTFEWEGIDGSAVIAHFPPADTYGAEANAADLLKTVDNNQSKCVQSIYHVGMLPVWF